MNSLTKDFLEASYGKNGMWPTVENSTSGVLFLIGGGIAGFYVAFLLHIKGPAVLCSVALGATVAQFFHRGIRDSMQSTHPKPVSGQPPTQELARYVFAKCRQCNQELRFPAGGVAKLRCPKCKAE